MTFNILKYRKSLVQGKLTVKHIEQLTHMMKYNGIAREEIPEDIQDEWCDENKTEQSSVSTDTSIWKKNKRKKS
jgi:hypothetical protein